MQVVASNASPEQAQTFQFMGYESFCELNSQKDIDPQRDYPFAIALSTRLMRNLLSATPSKGDIVIVDGYYGQTIRAVIENIRNGRATMCKLGTEDKGGYAHISMSESGQYSLSISGGPWLGAEVDKMEPTAETILSTFWEFSAKGVGGNRGFMFDVPVRIWRVTVDYKPGIVNY